MIVRDEAAFERGYGVPEKLHRYATENLRQADAVLSANWQFLSFQTADANGNFSIIDNPLAGTKTRFYRAIIP